jgi:serine protease AprX
MPGAPAGPAPAAESGPDTGPAVGRSGRGPSAALLKAVLVAATTRLPCHRPEADVALFGYPDFDQGFGRLDLTHVLPVATPEGRRLWWDDVASDGPGALESRPPVGARHTAARRYRFEVVPATAAAPSGGGGAGEARPLRIVVAWTDVNEAAIQNCLSVELQGPGGLRVRGNAEHRWKVDDERLVDPRARSARIDRRNNVQAVGLPQAPPGRYTLTVFASNTLFPPQGYGLCICGHLAGDPTAT